MIPFAVGLGAGDPSLPLHTAFSEPVGLAATWIDQPPWILLVLVVLTMAVMHFQSAPAPGTRTQKV